MVVLVLAAAGCRVSGGPGGAPDSTSPPAPGDTCRGYPAEITESDADQGIHLPAGRFSVCLDEGVHPLGQLDITGCPIALVSNLSVAGPDRYPVGYEVVGDGTCTLHNGDFRVELVFTT